MAVVPLTVNEGHLTMKQWIVGSMLGRTALYLRDKIEILRTSLFQSERVGTVANDQLAAKLVTRICASGRTFIDVGAHIGSVLSEVAHWDESIRIVAVEAMPAKAEALRRKFPHIVVHECAAGESTGEAPFFVNLRQTGYSTLARPGGESVQPTSELRVPVRRLDDLIKSDDVDVMKIDVEGAELGVLRGSARLLHSCRPIVMFESAPQSEDGLGFTKEAMFQFLESSECAVLVPNRVAHNDPGLTRDGFLESHLYPRRTTNYFAVPKERRIEVRDKARDVLGVVIS